ncbi:hypothetical protein KOAAANKH_00573 [Brevundimonas sp. NIBR10]|uniref:MgtC/SapB family protein n=1 Tax=Brevundimonas sp. NIBR10 TaxID=3015997 RepID=UPI0022F1D407|nr:MgtC/SapB family protein [Brevundimonas sp. NIBR10]WGM45709.1 hypothetical protein KOAAANKH_00573 [Brevundimonas sp. NIBR10]
MIEDWLSDLQAHGPPIIGAVIAGGAIGLEREWRGRSAGFRTHILVCLASALLMQAAMTQADWAFQALPDENIVTDPTRMAHGVLTGIGFLCAGVIFRTGLSIHGLTTAASLWITSALGILFGAGLNGLGVTGTVVTLAILVLLRMVAKALPGLITVDVAVSWPGSASGPRAEVERRLAAVDPGFRITEQKIEPDRSARSEAFRLRIKAGDLATLADDLAAVPGLGGVTIDPRDD